MELTIHTRKSAWHSFYLISLIHVVVPFFHWHTCHNIFLRNVNHHRQECVRLLCLSLFLDFFLFWSKCFEYEGPKNNNERKVDNIRVEKEKRKHSSQKYFNSSIFGMMMTKWKILKRFVELNWNKSIDLQQPNRTKPKTSNPTEKTSRQRARAHLFDCNESFCLMGWLGLRLLNFCSLCIFHHRYSFQSTLCIVLWISCSLSHKPENMEHLEKKNAAMVFFSLNMLVFFSFRVKFPKWNSVQKARNTLQLNSHN